MKICVVGPSGSGKSTLARELARRFDAPHIELDRFLWGEKWSRTDKATFDARVDEATRGDHWVVDGNHPLVHGRAEHIVWLDFPLRVVLPRVVLRSARRLATGEVLWNGNRESLRRLLPIVRLRGGRFEWNDDNLFGWMVSSHRERQRVWTQRFSQLDCTLHRLRSSTEIPSLFTTIQRAR